MLAAIEKSKDGYTARFERPLNHSVEEVWAALTENRKLTKWMHNLKVGDLRKGGTIQFHMNDGTGQSFDMKITDYLEMSVLEFEWGNGRVRFELSPTPDGCLLVLNEFIPALTEHSRKDLAGWHVCLDLLYALLEGHNRNFPMDEWEKWFEQYKAVVNK